MVENKDPVVEKKDPVVEVSESKSSYILFLFGIITNILLLGGNSLSIFLSVYPGLVHSVTPCVMTVADLCYSKGLISPDMYDQLLQRQNWIDVEKTRNLLSSIRTVLSTRPTALKEFVTVLSQVDYCRQVADKIQQQLQ